MLEIVFEDENYIAINKPNGLLVHRSAIARDVDTFAVQELRDQINQHVFPAHRLDRKTSGVLLFAKNKNALSAIRKLFENKEIKKEYLAIVRGFTDPKGLIDYPLTNEKGIVKEAITDFETIETSEIPVALGKFPTSRYSLVKLTPQTGRMHQLRKHMAHILHPIIGDRPHGCNKQNRHFKLTWNSETMLLHANSMSFTHPLTLNTLDIRAGLPNEFVRISGILKFGSNFDSIEKNTA
ncbi:MAG: pseudouridine synthase [Cyclobacteriaceae bacterium]